MPFITNVQVSNDNVTWVNCGSTLRPGKIYVKGQVPDATCMVFTATFLQVIIDPGTLQETSGDMQTASFPPDSGAPNFKQHWDSYSPPACPSGMRCRYDIILTAMCGTDTDTYTCTVNFADSVPVGSPEKPSTMKAAPAKEVHPVLLQCANPKPGYCLSFPHDNATACYNQKDGLLAFGPTHHCLRLQASLVEDKLGAKPHPGKVIQMDCPWWIIQFKGGADMPVGRVLMQIVDLGDPKHITFKVVRFCITGACPP